MSQRRCSKLKPEAAARVLPKNQVDREEYKAHIATRAPQRATARSLSEQRDAGDMGSGVIPRGGRCPHAQKNQDRCRLLGCLVKTVWSQDYTSQGRCREGLQSPPPQRLCGGAVDLCSEARCRERALPRQKQNATVATAAQQAIARGCCTSATQKFS